MTSRLNPYISFKDNARQAMEFYQQVFGGELSINTFGEYGQADTPIADLVMHGMLETPNGFTLMGADTPPGMDYTPGTTMTVSLSGDDAEAPSGLLGPAQRGRQRRRAVGAPDVGRHVRHGHRSLRHAVDGEHRRFVTR